ncbi:Paraneoplastic antigen Ma1-like [Acipenser ruthenus]|uniref:Paraneoplastic antigen Ma1-like n=1 Tax=Acipenser ruthenus TaxID=7906 RepID=A0A662YSJ8_ACIRT|nr:Paraneoplastic antigen Ma1-like [Acipenser ruthenus]
MEAARLTAWCKWESMDPSKAVAVAGVKEDQDMNMVVAVLEDLNLFGRVKSAIDTGPHYFGGPPSNFADSLNAFLASEGHTAEDVQRVVTAPPQSAPMPEAIIEAMGKMLKEAMRPHYETSSYKRLRPFSEIVPTPAGKDGFDSWLDQATQMLPE